MKSVGKRGVSTIIATVMLILLALIAIFLLWFFLRPTIVGTEEKLGTTADCINVRVEPVNCEYYKSKLCDGTIVTVGVRRAAGIGNYNSVQFLFTKNQGVPFNLDYGGLDFGNHSRLTETQYGKYGHFWYDPSKLDIPIRAGDNLTTFNTAVLVGKEKKACNPLTVPIPCVEKVSILPDVCSDFLDDDVYDFFDFTAYINHFVNKTDPEGNFNGDGVRDIDDYLAFCSTLDAQSLQHVQC